MNRAITNTKIGDYDNACADWERAAELGNETARNNLKYCNSDGTWRASKEDWLSKGRKQMSLEDYTRAIRNFNKALKIDPKFVRALNNRAVAKRESGDPKGAIVDYDKALSIDPNYTSSIGGKGTAKSYLKDIDGACADWNKAVITGDDKVAQKL